MQYLTFFMYILLAVLILLVMITIHELGHYTAGKLLKFKINEFAVGFGPKVFSKTKKNGEVFSLRAVPLGGFCAFEGESDTDEKANSKSFINEKPWKRVIVLLAGVAFNFLSAIIFSLIYISVVGYTVPKVADIYENPQGVAYVQSLKRGDIILEVDGRDVTIMKTFQDLTADYNNGDRITLTVLRDENIIPADVEIQEISYIDENGNTKTYSGLGISTASISRKVNFGYALKYCVPFTGKLSWAVLGAFGQIITGRVPITQMTGPVGTISMMAEVSMMNWMNIFILLPLIASNLAIFNLLPIPALDGSKVLFTTIEWIRKKPINRKVENYIHFAGLAALLLFVIVVDILSFVL